jgi:hypothetical protein
VSLGSGNFAAAIQNPDGTFITGTPIKKDGKKAKSQVNFGPDGRTAIVVYFSAPLTANVALKKTAF